MRKLFLILFIFSCFFASAQKIQYVNTYGYQYQRIIADTLLGLPKDTFAVPTVLRTIPFLAIKSGTLYRWNISTFAWNAISGGSSSIFVNAPLTLDGDTIEIAEVSTLNDGYLSAVNYTRFDSLRNHWYRGGAFGNYLRANNAGDSVIIGTHPSTVHRFNLVGNMFWEGTAFTTANRRMMEINTGLQNVDIGGRSGNASRSGTENTSVGEFAGSGITTSNYNTFFGKGVGAGTMTGLGNIGIGRNTYASGTIVGDYNVVMAYNGANPVHNDSSYQINIAHSLFGHKGRFKIGGQNTPSPITASATRNPTAVWDIDTITGYSNLRLREMSADPTQINDGNIWHYNDHVYARLNGATYQLDQQAGSLADGDKGDITVSGGAATWTIDNNVVTYAKMQDVSAASKLIGRGDSGSGDPQEITIGSGLQMSGTTLSATGGGATIGTYATRIGLTPSDGDEFFQTDDGRDSPPGKYYYLNSRWNFTTFDNERLIKIFDEFYSVGAANTVSGSFVLTATGSITPTSNGARFSTTTGTTGRAVVYSGANGVFGGWIDLDLGHAYFKVNITAISALSSVGDEYILRVGLGDVTAGADWTNGLYVEYDRLTSTNWGYVSAQASSRSRSASGTAVTAAAHYIEIFYNGTQAEYWVDGTSLGTKNTQIPTAIISPVVQLVKSAGSTPVTVDVDYIKAWHYLTTSRN